MEAEPRLLALLLVVSTSCGSSSGSPLVARFTQLSNELCRERDSTAGPGRREERQLEQLRAVERQDGRVPALRALVADREALNKQETANEPHPYLTSRAGAERVYRLRLKVRGDEQALGLQCPLPAPAAPTPPFAPTSENPRARHRSAAVGTPAREEGAGRRLTGIIYGVQAPPRSRGEPYFFSLSHWAGEVNGHWYVVWAGATTKRPSPDGKTRAIRSAVAVGREPAKVGSGEAAKIVGIFPTPGSGREFITVATVRGDELTLRSPAGRSFSFDVATRTFGGARRARPAA